MLELCDAFGLQSELRGSGLNAQIDPDERPQLAEAITQARRRLVEREGALEEISDVVEFWDRRRFNENATIAENVLFGMPRDRSVALINLPKLPEVEKVLAGTEAALALSNIGLAVVNAMIELLRSVSADSRLMKDMNLIKLEDLPVYERIAKRASERGLSGLRASERARLAGVAFGLNPARHRLGVMKEEWREAVLTAREMMEPVRAAGDVLVAFDSDKFIPGLSLRDNLLVGKPRLNRRERWDRIDEFLNNALIELNLELEVKRAALDTPVASGGSGLSSGNRLKLALIRALIRRPQFLILDGVAATSSHDDERLFKLITSQLGDCGLLYGATSETSARRLDQSIVIQNGRIVAQGASSDVVSAAAE